MTTQTQNTKDQNARTHMNNMYRWTRHIYDASRKYFLLGRDHLIANLHARDAERVCIIGCGTGRNMIKMAHAYPTAEFFGLDASDEMLKTAIDNIKRADFVGRFKMAQGLAQSFNPAELFGMSDQARFDKFTFSYTLSIIPEWRESLDHALNLLDSGGEIHIVDFSGQEGLPQWFRALLFWWLKMFHVYHKPEIESYLLTMEERGEGRLHLEPLYKGYAYYAVFTKA